MITMITMGYAAVTVKAVALEKIKSEHLLLEVVLWGKTVMTMPHQTYKMLPPPPAAAAITTDMEAVHG